MQLLGAYSGPLDCYNRMHVCPFLLALAVQFPGTVKWLSNSSACRSCAYYLPFHLSSVSDMRSLIAFDRTSQHVSKSSIEEEVNNYYKNF
jgi:hypothetical protein